MKKYFKVLVSSTALLLFASSAVHALCDFEKVLIGSSLNSFQNKFIGISGTSSSKLHGYDIPIEHICDDFEQAVVKYNFIDKDLHQIIITDYQNDADYFKSLKYHYGDPTEGYDRPGTSGLAYHYWNKSGKSIFLIDKIFGESREQIVEIVSDRFNELSLKHMDVDNE
tara:strand:+ start:142 stop:645 length:504 start_codon:yes stop_codon:yes gene_type:complete